MVQTIELLAAYQNAVDRTRQAHRLHFTENVFTDHHAAPTVPQDWRALERLAGFLPPELQGDRWQRCRFMSVARIRGGRVVRYIVPVDRAQIFSGYHRELAAALISGRVVELEAARLWRWADQRWSDWMAACRRQRRPDDDDLPFAARDEFRTVRQSGRAVA